MFQTPGHERAEHIRLACLLEATARKPGNVHPQASFDDLCYRDFVISAETVAPLLAESGGRGVGRTVLDAVTATQRAVGRNTNLGTVLLLAPLAAVGPESSLEDGIDGVLDNLTQEDARLVYRAIRTAGAGGLGQVAEQDVADEPTGTLRDVMRLAAERDRVAAQYADGFRDVLQVGVPFLAATDDFASRWEETVIGLQLELMARFPDSLIARKRGPAEAQASADCARDVLKADWPATPAGRRRLQELDRWLREEGNRRNPGTTADLVAASLFAALRCGAVSRPDHFS